ncbi:hypothetical protein HZH68_016568 [Vespula germanica]|uniref:Uncharacterized protein n=1 Tax=Vespula germanica TaxID=30212 RepID=A0A834MNP0_VESGE|nr:hypothetical protein HZH68_016568 [Vespula germanica]
MQSLESVFVRVVFEFLTVAQTVLSQCITEEDLVQLRCRPTSFSTNYKSSTLNVDLIRGPVFWSHRRTSEVVIVGCARSKDEAMCRRASQKLWFKRAAIGLLFYFGRYRSVRSEGLENLSPREDLEIFASLRDFENLSVRVDLEIFASLRDFENLSPRVDLEILARCRILASINEDLKSSLQTRALQ